MSMFRALGLLAAGGAKGYQDGIDEKLARDHKAEDRAWEQEQRTRQRKEWGDVDAEKQRVADASQNVTPTEVKADRPAALDEQDNDQPFAALPTAGYDVQGARFTDQAAANTAAQAANTPQGKAGRMAAALQQRSPERAMALQTSARQGELADVNLSEAKQAAADNTWERGLRGLKDENDMAEFLSKSNGDGQGGAFKTTAVRSPDGKTFAFHKVNPDGTTTPVTKGFESMDEARMNLSTLMTPEKRLAHYEGLKRRDQDVNFRDKVEERRGKHEDRMLENSNRMVTLAEQRAQKGDAPPAAVTPESTFDYKTANELAKERVKGLREQRAAENKPMTSKEEDEAVASHVEAFRNGHNQRFQAQVVSNALSMSSGDPASYSDTYAKAVKKGFSPDALNQLGFKPPSGAVQPAAPAAGAPGAPAAPAAPAQPSVTSRIGAAIRQAQGEAQQQGGEYQELQRRVRLASSGQYQLTPQDIALARQYGIGIPG